MVGAPPGARASKPPGEPGMVVRGDRASLRLTHRCCFSLCKYVLTNHCLSPNDLSWEESSPGAPRSRGGGRREVHSAERGPLRERGGCPFTSESSQTRQGIRQSTSPEGGHLFPKPVKFHSLSRCAQAAKAEECRTCLSSGTLQARCHTCLRSKQEDWLAQSRPEVIRQARLIARVRIRSQGLMAHGPGMPCMSVDPC